MSIDRVRELVAEMGKSFQTPEKLHELSVRIDEHLYFLAGQVARGDKISDLVEAIKALPNGLALETDWGAVDHELRAILPTEDDGAGIMSKVRVLLRQVAEGKFRHELRKASAPAPASQHGMIVPLATVDWKYFDGALASIIMDPGMGREVVRLTEEQRRCVKELVEAIISGINKERCRLAGLHLNPAEARAVFNMADTRPAVFRAACVNAGITGEAYIKSLIEKLKESMK
jgi:hypothetical protein